MVQGKHKSVCTIYEFLANGVLFQIIRIVSCLFQHATVRDWQNAETDNVYLVHSSVMGTTTVKMEVMKRTAVKVRTYYKSLSTHS